MVLLLTIAAWCLGGAVLSVPVAGVMHRAGRDLECSADDELATSDDR